MDSKTYQKIRKQNKEEYDNPKWKPPMWILILIIATIITLILSMILKGGIPAKDWYPGAPPHTISR